MERSTWNIPVSGPLNRHEEEFSARLRLQDRDNGAGIGREGPGRREPQTADRRLASEALDLLRRHEEQTLSAGHEDRLSLASQQVVRTDGAHGQVSAGEHIGKISIAIP